MEDDGHYDDNSYNDNNNYKEIEILVEKSESFNHGSPSAEEFKNTYRAC